MAFGEYIMYAETYIRINRAQRKGQAYYNVFVIWYPELVYKVAGTDIDPFYRDDRLPDFLAFVEESLLDT